MPDLSKEVGVNKAYSSILSRFFTLFLGVFFVTSCSYATDYSAKTPEATVAQSLAQPPIPQTFSGSYLAGRFAQHNQDWDHAFDYMSLALALSDNLDQNGLLDRTFLLALGNGKIEQAARLADKILMRKSDDDLARIFKMTLAFQNQNYPAAHDILADMNTTHFSAYITPLLQSWVYVSEENIEMALSTLKESQYPDDPVYILHRALIQDMSGQSDPSDLYISAFEKGLLLHQTLIAANFFERAENETMARKIYEALHRLDPKNQFSKGGYDRIDTKTIPEPMIATATDGMAFTLFSMASLLYERHAYDSALIYGRMVENIQPDNAYNMMMLGDIMALSGKYNEAIDYYRNINSQNILFKMARLRMIEVLETSGRVQEALDILTVMAEQDDDVHKLEALAYIGNIYLRQQKFDHALIAYDQALNHLGENITAQHWNLIYARGMSYERLNKWSAAEKDLLHALEYQPENPHILNYLGYSWVEQGIHLDRALEMIKKAVVLKPNDGHIIDSYGWAYYKIGNYTEAVYWLERAVEILPEDAVLNDHLGDAYWQDNRQKEARFQWKRAHKLSQDPDKKATLKDKIKYGLRDAPQQHIPQNQEAALYTP